MNAEDNRTSPTIVDIWFLNVSLPASHLSLSCPSESSSATDRPTYMQYKHSEYINPNVNTIYIIRVDFNAFGPLI